MVFMPFDLVGYCGRKFNELRPKMGEVVARVKNTNKYVVDFGSEDAYLISGENLRNWVSQKDKAGMEVIVHMPRRRRDDEE